MSKRAVQNVETETIPAKALRTFGRRKMDSLAASFRSAVTGNQLVPSETLEHLLRANGLCPSKREVSEFKTLLRGRAGVSFDSFLEIAMQCERVSTTCGMSELIEFFAPYDLQNRGVVPQKVFRQIMLNCGEWFTEREMSEIVSAFQARGQGDSVDYRAFITTIAAT